MEKNTPAIDPILIPALQRVKYPGFDDTDILAMGLVEEAKVEGSVARIKLRTLSAPPEVREKLEDDIAAQIGQVPGVREMEINLPEAPKAKPKEPSGPKPIPGVTAVVPVASGKGGVGKSTVSVNLALGLKELGLKVGLLDLDLYGPSIPLMMGITGAEPGGEGGHIQPVEKHGIKVLSIGLLIPADKALIWRGPIIMKAVRQLLHDVDWAPLDVLILDLPPGTGDVQITMTQEAPVTGAVVVTTPQDVALADAVKAVDLFHQAQVPILGVVENMSFFLCPDCGGRHEIFGHGSVAPLSERLGVEFLGEVPLDPTLARLADQGHSALEGDTPTSQAYRKIAQKVKDRLDAARKEA